MDYIIKIMSIKRKNKISPNFNMSSMTDIVFLLLIFFMLTSTLIIPNALDLSLPSSQAQTIENQTHSIEIEQNDSIINFYINTQPIKKENLENELIKRINTKDNEGIILYTDKSVAIEHVVYVLEIANENKYKIVLATDPN